MPLAFCVFAQKHFFPAGYKLPMVVPGYCQRFSENLSSNTGIHNIIMETYGNMWKHMETYGNMWKHVETYGNMWKHMETYGSTWKHTETYGNYQSVTFPRRFNFTTARGASGWTRLTMAGNSRHVMGTLVVQHWITSYIQLPYQKMLHISQWF